MHWLQSFDATLFHWVNPTLSNSFLDVVMPFCSGNPYFAPAAVLVCAALCCKGGARGRLCALMLVLAVALGDTYVCNTLKQLIHRPRPFIDIMDTHIPAGMGRTESGSMPSSHAANWFAATMVAFIYYRRSIRFMLPAAVLVSFSRIYNGMHYPSDVLVGAVLGAGYAAAGVLALNELWRWAGRRWFPLWWERLPSVINPIVLPAKTPPANAQNLRDKQWMSLGYALILIQLAAKLVYIAGGRIDLQEDEAYQWIWSKHLALSYYSKPPMIAYTQFFGTTLFGDNAFGVRFFSPVITAIVSIVMLRFLAWVVNAHVAFWVSALRIAVPLFAVGSTLLTIDPLSVMFWTFAMVSGWRAIQANATTRDWLWTGLWMGLGLLSKYTELFQWLCWAFVFILWPPARKHLRRPGPYLALLINLLFAVPVLIWNYQHHWITVAHVASNGGLDHPWALTPANLWSGFTRYGVEFIIAEALFLNPFFLIPAIWAAIAFWRARDKSPLLVYFFCMSAPVLIFYSLLTFRSRVQPNWIAPAILPLYCLAAIYWEQHWQAGRRAIKYWLAPGMIIFGLGVVLLHDTNLIKKISGHPLPPKADPLRRVSGWKETAQTIESARQTLFAEGKPAFVIGGHYGITSEYTFYIPEARAVVRDHPLAFYRTATTPENQFFFWPGYLDHKGQNAIYVDELELLDHDVPDVPDVIKQEFESVRNLGAVMVQYRGQPIRRIQIVECRNLR